MGPEEEKNRKNEYATASFLETMTKMSKMTTITTMTITTTMYTVNYAVDKKNLGNYRTYQGNSINARPFQRTRKRSNSKFTRKCSR